MYILHMCRTICVTRCVSYTCIICVEHVIQLYFYACNTPKIPHMFYRCCTTGHVIHLKHNTCITGIAQLAMY